MEAGLDIVDIDRVVSERKMWKSMVGKKMEHLERWKRQKGNHYEMGAGEESVQNRCCGAAVGNPLQYKYDECGSVQSESGAGNLHEEVAQRVD